MRRFDAHEYREAYNAQAVVSADGMQLILATDLVGVLPIKPDIRLGWVTAGR